MIGRREFLQRSGSLVYGLGLPSLLSNCSDEKKRKETLRGPNAQLGHRLREAQFSPPSHIIKTEVVIVGGGVSGLASARILKNNGTAFQLLELENNIGGNSSSGSNFVSSYPLGAHYLPIPGTFDQDLLTFLHEQNVITGYEKGKPIYNDYYLCFDPKERLYINNHWQEGLIPASGIDKQANEEFDKFHTLINTFKTLKGADGKDAFCIPLHYCSNDPAIKNLDSITFQFFLNQYRFKSTYLLWYLNYCCADDFGGSVSTISAWAGLHYFCSRKGVASNAQPDAVLTWPEGNGWLINKLKQFSSEQTITNCLVYQVGIQNNKCYVNYFDALTNKTIKIECEKVIMATPQYVNKRLFGADIKRELDHTQFSYAPWMIANFTCNGYLEEKRGEQLSWDNVIYGSNSLGYVNANHQNINLFKDRKVITYYRPLTSAPPEVERKLAFSRGFNEWFKLAIDDLRLPHPTIENSIEEADIWVWGHGMIRPSVNFITKTAPDASKPINQKIFFVHTDTSGISIFEEAFFSGTQIAKSILTEKKDV